MTALLDPDTPPVGRQPTSYRVTPSKAQPWYGGISGGDTSAHSVTGGRRYTAQQDAELARRRIDPGIAPSLLVKRQATHHELWWPAGTLPPVYAFECPVIGRRAEQVKVIAPNGDAKLVQANGWAHRPYRRPRDEWGSAI